MKEEAFSENRYKVHYSCEQVFRGKEEKEAIWPPPTWQALQLANKAYLDDICLNDPAISISDFYRADRQNGMDTSGQKSRLMP